jgi:hypothetical protein
MIGLLKESLYSIDFWIYREVIRTLVIEESTNPSLDYDTATILIIAAQLKETILGWMIISTYYAHHNPELWNVSGGLLWDIYLEEILCVDQSHTTIFKQAILTIHQRYSDILHDQIKLDDNPAHLAFCIKNRKKFAATYAGAEELMQAITTEDVLRFHGLLKHISYYNKRYVIPHEVI